MPLIDRASGTVNFKSKEERFYNELYTLVRTLEEVLTAGNPECQEMLSQNETVEQIRESNAKILASI